MAHDVFISYSAKDKTTADAVCAMLESESIRCWIAPRDVLPSMEWGESIIDAIEQCRIMVLVFTANANASPQIRREIERAANHGIAILPLRVEDVLPGKSLQYFIGNVHWLDALTPPFEAHLKNLAGTIKIVLARMEPRDAPPEQQTIAREAPRVAKPPESTVTPPAEAPVVPHTPHPVESALQETEVAGPVMVPEAGPERAESSSLESIVEVGASAPALVEVSGHDEAHSAEVGPPPFAPEEVPPENHTEVPTTGRRKVRISAVRMFAILGGAAVLVASLSLFLIRREAWSARHIDQAGWLNAIFGTSDGKRLWVVGQNGLILESDDWGATWTARNSGTKSGLDSIFGTSDGMRLWAVGYDYASQNGAIIESSDEGVTWSARTKGAISHLKSIFGTSDGQRLWSVGDIGTIVGSDDGGVNWTKRKSGTTLDLNSIFGTSDGQRLWAVGDQGTIVESDDGGVSWTVRKIGRTGNLLSIFGTSDGKRLWSVGYGGTIVGSGDGGATWVACDIGTTEPFGSIFGTKDGKWLLAVGWNGTTVESNDGGASWTARDSGTKDALVSIFVTSDGKRLWVIGQGGALLESRR